MKILPLDQVDKIVSGASDPNLWTAIIPAAGKGARLGYDKPKILYPIAGRPILDWLIDLLLPHCRTLIFSLSPAGAEHVVPELTKRIDGKFEVAVLDSRGMADSIYAALQRVTTPNVLMIWGDQVAIRPATIKAVITLHQSDPTIQLTMPVVERDNPYIHFATDATGRFIQVLEKREGAFMPPVGLNDCGLFACDTARLKDIFDQEVAHGITLSQSTQEWNFLPLLPQLENGDASVQAIQLASLEETIGVNDASDVAILEKYLNRRAHHAQK